MFMKNEWVPDAHYRSTKRLCLFECSSYVCLGREVNMMYELKLCKRKRTYKGVNDIVNKLYNIHLRAHLLNSTVLPALTRVTENWIAKTQWECDQRYRTLRQEGDARTNPFHASESKTFGVPRYVNSQRLSTLPPTPSWAKSSERYTCCPLNYTFSDKITRDVKRLAGSAPKKWSDFFTKRSWSWSCPWTKNIVLFMALEWKESLDNYGLRLRHLDVLLITSVYSQNKGNQVIKVINKSGISSSYAP